MFILNIQCSLTKPNYGWSKHPDKGGITVGRGGLSPATCNLGQSNNFRCCNTCLSPLLPDVKGEVIRFHSAPAGRGSAGVFFLIFFLLRLLFTHVWLYHTHFPKLCSLILHITGQVWWDSQLQTWEGGLNCRLKGSLCLVIQYAKWTATRRWSISPKNLHLFCMISDRLRRLTIVHKPLRKYPKPTHWWKMSPVLYTC